MAYVSFEALYCLVPWLWNRRGSTRSVLVDWHFWVSTVGIVLYITSMWVAGIMQGLMWRAYNALGFLDLLCRDRRGHAALLPDPGVGGVLFLIGALIMAYNIAMTILGREAEEAEHRLTPALAPAGVTHLRQDQAPWPPPARLEKARAVREELDPLVIGILIVVAIGGLIEIVPLFYLKSTIEKVEGMRPYTPLELAGRNIYVREGCYLCHSQMVRPMRDEVERYGPSRSPPRACTITPSSGARSARGRTSRVGGKYSDEWHQGPPEGRSRSCRPHHARVSVPGPSARHGPIGGSRRTASGALHGTR